METITAKQVEIPASVSPKITKTISMFGNEETIDFVFQGIGKNGKTRHLSQKKFVPQTATEAKAFLLPFMIKGFKGKDGYTNPVRWHLKRGLALADSENADAVLRAGGIVINEDGTIAFLRNGETEPTTYKLQHSIALIDGQLDKAGCKTSVVNMDNDSETTEDLPYSVVEE